MGPVLLMMYMASFVYFSLVDLVFIYWYWYKPCFLQYPQNGCSLLQRGPFLSPFFFFEKENRTHEGLYHIENCWRLQQLNFQKIWTSVLFPRTCEWGHNITVLLFDLWFYTKSRLSCDTSGFSCGALEFFRLLGWIAETSTGRFFQVCLAAVLCSIE